ncbi:MAG: type II secretion system protein GspM [Deltaproteobacteria bacterium]
MNRLSDIKSRIGTKPLLIGIVVLLMVLNLFRFAVGSYENKKETIQARQELLARYEASLRQLPSLRSRVSALDRQKKMFQSYLFSGGSEEEIASSMQIMIQKQLVEAGLNPESLRPLRSGDTKGKEYGEISIKVRSAGTLNEFISFLSNLYRSRQLLRIESFTLKPYNQSELKIFIDFKGYYKLA